MRTLASSIALSLVFATPPSAAAHGALHPRIEAVTARLEAAPRDAALLVRRAELLRLHGEPIAALRDLERAASLDADRVDLHATRARAHLDRGALEDAEASADRWLARAPEDLAALRLRAAVRARRGDRTGALSDLAVAADFEDAPPDVELDRARLLAEATPPRIDEALAGLDDALARRGPVVVLQLEAIALEERRGDVDAALVRLDRIAAASPREEPWIARRGDLLLRAGRRDEARAAYRRCRDALDRRPAHRRTTKQITDLTAHVRLRLEELNH